MDSDLDEQGNGPVAGEFCQLFNLDKYDPKVLASKSQTSSRSNIVSTEGFVISFWLCVGTSSI